MSYKPVGQLTNLPKGHPCEECTIRPITICRRLDPKTLADLRALGAPQRVHPGQSIFHEGDPVNRLFMLVSGTLKIYALLADGRRQVTGFMFPGDLLGISVEEEYAFTAEALSDGELWWFARKAFDAFVDQNPDVERELYRLAVHELAAAQRQMVLLGRKSAAERLASFFLMLLERSERVSGRSEEGFDLPMSRLDIADYLGLTKETVSRMTGRLRDRGLIRLESQNRVEVIDRPGLTEMAAGFGED